MTITGDDIEPYEESGVTFVNGGRYDFVVISRAFEIHDVTFDITFVSIHGGTFEMGADDLHNDCDPIHRVILSGYEMSTTEITNLQYAAYLNKALASGYINEPSEGVVTGKTGWYSNQDFINLSESLSFLPNNECWIVYDNGTFSAESGYENWPVVWVTWYGAKAFALYYGYDLPTEAEWEYAAQGGKQYKYGTDDGTINASKVNYRETEIKHPIDVGIYPPNPFGLYDMTGNVWEWCNDWYDPDITIIAQQTIPQGHYPATTVPIGAEVLLMMLS